MRTWLGGDIQALSQVLSCSALFLLSARRLARCMAHPTTNVCMLSAGSRVQFIPTHIRRHTVFYFAVRASARWHVTGCWGRCVTGFIYFFSKALGRNEYDMGLYARCIAGTFAVLSCGVAIQQHFTQVISILALNPCDLGFSCICCDLFHYFRFVETTILLN